MLKGTPTVKAIEWYKIPKAQREVLYVTPNSPRVQRDYKAYSETEQPLVCTARAYVGERIEAYQIQNKYYSPDAVRQLLGLGVPIIPLKLAKDNRVYIAADYDIKVEQARFEKPHMAKALNVGIYKHKGSNSSNHGISAQYDEVLVLCEEGIVSVDLDNPPKNLCVIQKQTRTLGGEPYWYATPYAKPTGLGWMYGGCLLYSSDARFSRISGDTPICLYDRTETQAQYDALSR